MFQGEIIKYFITIILITQILGASENTLDFKRYLKEIKSKNLSIKIKKNTLKKSALEIKQGYYNFLPKVDLSYGPTFNLTPSKSKIPGVPSATNPNWTKSLTVDLPIFLGGKRLEYIKVGKLNHVLNDYDLKLKLLELKSKAVNLFIQAYAYQNQLKILKQALKLAEKNVKDAHVLKSLGKLVKVDLLTYELSLEERKLAILDIQNKIRNNFYEMSNIIDEELEVQRLEMDIKTPEVLDKKTQKELLSYYLNLLTKQSLVIQQTKAYKKMAKHNLSLSYRNYLPHLSMRYTYSPFTDNFWEFPLDTGHNLMFMLSFNVFNQLNDSFDIKKKKIDLLTSEYQLKEVENMQSLAIKKAVNSFYNARLQLTSAETALALSKEKMEQVHIGYDSGKYSYLDVLKAENDWLVKENNLLNLRIQIYSSFYQLELISGNINE